MAKHHLSPLLVPESIAIIGASRRKDAVGARVLSNLVKAGFAGPIYPVNPNAKRVQNRKCHPAVGKIGKPVDLAVIATPAATVPALVEECGEAGVRAVAILSAGFGEAGREGERMQRQIVKSVRRFGMRLLGPNCLGVMRPDIGMNATFTKITPRSGELALISQSGALCSAILDWAEAEKIGFSTVISLGDTADVDFGEVLEFLAMDEHTRSILLYIEGLLDARKFLSGLRVAARLKPVIVVKAGRQAEGSRAAVSHVRALIGEDDVFDAALQRAGAVRAQRIADLFAAASILSSGRRVQGDRLAIVTNGGGPGVIAADCAADFGLKIPELDPKTLARLNEVLPAHWSRGNPVDVLADAGVGRYETAVEVCLEDESTDGLLVMLTPQAMTEPAAVAEMVVEKSETEAKPVLTCWLGAQQVAGGRKLFRQGNVPTFRQPEDAVAAFSYLSSYRRNQGLLLEVPGPLSDRKPPSIAKARRLIQKALDEGRGALTTAESKKVLAAFLIPVVNTHVARSADAAVRLADEFDYPVVMKINSPDIIHKSDVGGVVLNMNSSRTVRAMYYRMMQQVKEACPEAAIEGVTIEPMWTSPNGRELMVGVISDPVFGPVVSFGAGGTAVEVIKDRGVALPPLNEVLIRQLISSTRVERLLGAFRNMPAVREEALIRTLQRVSEMVCELPEIQEMDINPLIGDENGVIALDARILLAPVSKRARRYGHMAIHPFPEHLDKEVRLRDGSKITLRPIRPEDAKIEDEFIRNLSSESKYFRFMAAVQELTREMLVRYTQIDYDREMAFIATSMRGGSETQIAVARYVTNADGKSCEFAIVVGDEWHGKGVATIVMNTLIEQARTKKLKTMIGEIFSHNHPMLHLCRSLGFKIATSEEDPGLKIATKKL